MRLKNMAVGLSLCALAVACAVPSATHSAQGKNNPGEVRNITEKEKEIGAKAHPELLRQFGGTFESSQTQYVVDIGKNIAFQSGLGNARDDFTVTLLNSSVNNAFAIPGGYVYVTRQLLGLMNDEAELAGVLGHEVGHVAARHSEKRQKAAQRNSILGLLGQIGSAVLLGDSEFGRVGQRLFGSGSQLLTLRYSRKQEREADNLGIEYLDKAGYDPQALSSMLYSLAVQNAVDQRAAGRSAGAVPEWASTHPNPAKRVSRAKRNAGERTGRRNREGFLNRINGMLYGDDPEQGIIEGRDFLHPDLLLKFTAPDGYGLANGTTAVTISGQVGRAQFSLSPYRNDLNAYVAGVFDGLSNEQQRLDYGTIQRTTVNGLPTAYATARTSNGRDAIDVTVFAYEFASDRAYHFVTVSPAGRGGVFNPMFGSIRRLSKAEAAEIKPRKLRVVTAGVNDSVASMAQKMAYDSYKTERFLALNGLNARSTLRRGQKVKIITY